MHQLFACVIAVDLEGWRLNVQGIPNSVRLRFSENNNDSRNPDLLVGTVVFVKVHHVDGVWEALSYEPIRQEILRTKGVYILSLEAMTQAVARYASRGCTLVGQPEFWETDGYMFRIQMATGIMELNASPTGKVQETN